MFARNPVSLFQHTLTLYESSFFSQKIQIKFSSTSSLVLLPLSLFSRSPFNFHLLPSFFSRFPSPFLLPFSFPPPFLFLLSKDDYRSSVSGDDNPVDSAVDHLAGRISRNDTLQQASSLQLLRFHPSSCASHIFFLQLMG